MHDVVRELFQALRARAEGTQGGFCVDQHVLGELVAHLHMHIVGGPDPVGPMLKKI